MYPFIVTLKSKNLIKFGKFSLLIYKKKLNNIHKLNTNFRNHFKLIIKKVYS
jgi:hypothetical protein